MKEYINIEFSYNGNLGILQQKTIDNKEFCRQLMQHDIISREEFKKTMQDIQAYFENEIKKVIETPSFYLL